MESTYSRPRPELTDLLVLGETIAMGYFPAVSAGWLLSEEPFLRASETISYMKLRASYGITGNANFANNAFVGTYFSLQQRCFL